MDSSRLQEFSWKRMVAAVDAVHERTCRISSALDRAEIPYLIVGGNAVAAWVARVDAEAVRNTKDVDLLVRRDDLSRVIVAAQAVGFLHRQVNGIDVLLDGPDGSIRSAVHLLFAREKVRADYVLATPDVTEREVGPEFTFVSLDALVGMKLNSFRDADRVHLRDLLSVGLVDASWLGRLPPPLAERLRDLLEHPE